MKGNLSTRLRAGSWRNQRREVEHVHSALFDIDVATARVKQRMCPLIVAVSDDSAMMGALVAKLRHVRGSRRRIGDRGTPRFALAELDYRDQVSSYLIS